MAVASDGGDVVGAGPAFLDAVDERVQVVTHRDHPW